MNYERFANSYHFFEKLFFGRLLEKCRFEYITSLKKCNTILLIGEGDGRFLRYLYAQHPKAKIDCIEISSKMIEKAQSRLSNTTNITFIQTDVLTYEANKKYDAIVTLFFLDNFNESNVKKIISFIENSLKIGGIWINSDFYEHKKGYKRWTSKFIVQMLYKSFNYLVNIEANQLYMSNEFSSGFTLESRKIRHFLVSEYYRKRYE